MQRFWTASLLAATLGFVAAAQADTVVRSDGATFTGEVTRSGNSYAVKSKSGTIVIAAEDVDHIIKETAPLVAPKPPVPGRPQPGAPAPVAVPARPGAKPADAKSLQALLDQGQAALSAGEYKAACDAFNDALTLDRRNVVALHGLGAAWMELHDFQKAKDPMERALQANPSPDRALVLNMAVMQIAVRNPMRAAKIVKDYLTAHNKTLDEPMLNAMAIALNNADSQARKGTLFISCVQFYLQSNARLEAAVPGQKRWGVQWLAAADVDQKMVEMALKQKEADRIGAEADAADARIEPLEQELEHERLLQPKGFYSAFDVQNAQLNVQNAVAERDRLAGAYDAALAAVPRPNFPAALSLVALNDLTPPPVRGITLALAVGPAGTGPDSTGGSLFPARPQAAQEARQAQADDPRFGRYHRCRRGRSRPTAGNAGD